MRLQRMWEGISVDAHYERSLQILAGEAGMNVPTCVGYVKPCPICGNHTQHKWRRGPFHDHVGWYLSGEKERPVTLWCYYCQCSMSGADLQDAVARWNDRRKFSHRN